MRKKIVIPVIIIALIAITAGVAYYAVKPGQTVSYIDQQVSEYTESGVWDEEAISSAFSEDSAEVLFSKGMTCYTQNRWEEAEQYFNQAAKKSSKDTTLPAYLDIYLNECTVGKTGCGNVTYVEKALYEMAKCPEITNQSYWVWHLVYPFVGSEEEGISASQLLQRYLDEAENLTEDQILQMKSYQAILKNITGEYSESIMLFYDILNQTEDLPESYAVVKTQSVCINYIAEMYFSYEDYEKANSLYRELLAKTIEDPYENAKLKYTAYTNMATIYLKQQDYEQARKIVGETEEKILPYLNESTAAEIKAYLYNVLTNIELEQGTLKNAREYFKECEDFLQSNKSAAFFDTEVYLRMTQCKILEQSGDFQQAESILKELLNYGIVESQRIYEVRKLLTDIYRLSGQEENYFKEQGLLLQEQDAIIQQYQSDYCEAINYYDQLASLKKEHKISVHRNEILVSVLAVVLILLVLIIRISLGRYKDSITDALSGLYNRKQLEKEILFYEKNNHKFMSYGIIMTDIDFFKRYNDTYGHAAGDEVIRRVADVLKQSVRKRDVVIRYGGEEFLVLLKDINSSTIESIAERMRINVQNEKIRHEASDASEYVSLSLGGFYVEKTISISLNEAIKEADKALYESKQGGRNRVTVM